MCVFVAPALLQIVPSRVQGFLMHLIEFGVRLFIVWTAASSCFIHGMLEEACDKSDLVGLKALFEATVGPHWTYSTSWLTSVSCCEWYGVTCDESSHTNESSRVIALKMPGNNLQGAPSTEHLFLRCPSFCIVSQTLFQNNS